MKNARGDHNGNLLTPIPLSNRPRKNSENGPSFNLMRRINDRREIGADLIFEGITPYKETNIVIPESKKGASRMQRLRDLDRK